MTFIFSLGASTLKPGGTVRAVQSCGPGQMTKSLLSRTGGIVNDDPALRLS
jgi:hypothetical protein